MVAFLAESVFSYFFSYFLVVVFLYINSYLRGLNLKEKGLRNETTRFFYKFLPQRSEFERKRLKKRNHKFKKEVRNYAIDQE